jgi:hypothetical protein
MMKTAEAATFRERCPVWTRVPIRGLALITALIMIAVIAVTLSMTAHGQHPVDQASGIAWVGQG